MKYIFKFPDIGEGLDEGIIVEWLVKKGQSIKAGDLLVTMETDKVVAEIPSPKTGTITNIFGKHGDTIKVGEALVEIEIEGIFGNEAVAETNKTELIEEEGAGVVGTLEIAGNNAVLKSSAEGISKTDSGEQISIKKSLATPVSRAMAKDLGIDINKVKGTGPAGRVMKEDILKYSENKSPVVKPTTLIVSEEYPTEIEKVSQIRKTIAKNMLLSKRNAAHMTVFDETEISELEHLRNSFKEQFAAEGIKLTYLAFVVKAVSVALKQHKVLNSEADLDNERIIYKKYYNIGIAVDTERGLMVPVIHHVDKLSIREIAVRIQEISEKARTGKIKLEDLSNGTFTITSYGSIGGKFAVPVINYPQVGILGVGRVSKQAIVRNDKLDIGLMMPLSVSVDHRIVDGGEVTRFLNTVMKILSEPMRLIME
jgi:pyruvate dehydrogenase E2 component (dihydrolipoamide acetyltransferase)